MSMTKRFSIGKINLQIDLLLPVVLVLIAGLLSYNYFPRILPGATEQTLWWAGFFGALTIIISILVHEGGHALAARVLNIPINRIHINLFGGIAELKHRPLFPRQEFYVALAGPLTSVALGLICYLSQSLLLADQVFMSAIITFAGYLNIGLAAFNILPVFPLDGGRAVRSFFWYRHKNFFHASGTMHRFSSMVIVLIFMLAFGAFIYQLRYEALFLGILGLYTAYLVMGAKEELIRLPRFEELVYQISPHASPAAIIEQLLELQSEILGRTIIPVIIDDRPQAVIYGKDIELEFGENPSIENYLKPLSEGVYIERHNSDSYAREVEYKADIVPVFDNGTLIGLADAQEVRFWLIETKR